MPRTASPNFARCSGSARSPAKAGERRSAARSLEPGSPGRRCAPGSRLAIWRVSTGSDCRFLCGYENPAISESHVDSVSYENIARHAGPARKRGPGRSADESPQPDHAGRAPVSSWDTPLPEGFMRAAARFAMAKRTPEDLRLRRVAGGAPASSDAPLPGHAADAVSEKPTPSTCCGRDARVVRRTAPRGPYPLPGRCRDCARDARVPTGHAAPRAGIRRPGTRPMPPPSPALPAVSGVLA